MTCAGGCRVLPKSESQRSNSCAANIIKSRKAMLNRDFKECVASFNAHGVEHLVVGGYALASRTCSRSDAD
jgi:hypothetical protein